MDLHTSSTSLAVVSGLPNGYPECWKFFFLAADLDINLKNKISVKLSVEEELSSSKMCEV